MASAGAVARAEELLDSLDVALPGDELDQLQQAFAEALHDFAAAAVGAAVEWLVCDDEDIEKLQQEAREAVGLMDDDEDTDDEAGY